METLRVFLLKEHHLLNNQPINQLIVIEKRFGVHILVIFKVAKVADNLFAMEFCWLIRFDD